MTTLTELKDQHRTVWASGRYADVAETIADAPVAQLLAAIDIAPEHAVLDVATGTGNVALRVAEISPDVTRLDLVPSLLDVARERAAAAGLDVHWVEGDAEALPFGEETFDRVLSVVGTQFAPRHQIVADELVRVCRPGGAIGLVNWTPEGLVGRMFGVFAKYMPAPPSWRRRRRSGAMRRTCAPSSRRTESSSPSSEARTRGCSTPSRTSCCSGRSATGRRSAPRRDSSRPASGPLAVRTCASSSRRATSPLTARSTSRPSTSLRSRGAEQRARRAVPHAARPVRQPVERAAHRRHVEEQRRRAPERRAREHVGREVHADRDPADRQRDRQRQR